ncbi:MAG: cobalt-zinc-cadmium efflux system protein [Acidimicrobiales bacterium]|jgi:cobalt-zinc-cadmium efflux system protein
MSENNHAGSGHAGHEGHNHGAAMMRAGVQYQRPLTIAFVLIGLFFIVEAVAGFWTNSLALLSDAGHMFTDVLGLGMALAAIRVAAAYEARGDGKKGSHTFGLYRLEILAAFVNALLLFAVAIYVLIEAIRRLFDEPEVLGWPMFAVAVVGLLVNIVAFLLLREGSKESINLEGAYLEVLADAVGSVGVIIAALMLEFMGWSWADPVIAALIGLWILPRTWRLGRQAVRILLQAAPEGLDLAQLNTELVSLPEVVDVHDLHVWTLTSGMEAASAHLMTRVDADHHEVLDQARVLLQQNYGIAHATLQVEPEDHTGCHELDW